MHTNFAHLKQQVVHGVDAIPVSFLAAALVPMPIWKRYLEQVSDYAHVAASVFGIALALLKGWAVWKESREARTSAAKGIADAAATAAKAGSRAPGFLVAALAGLGIVAAFSWLFASSASAAPAAPAASTSVSGRKRRVGDASGGESVDEPADIPDGAPPWMLKAYDLLGTTEKTSRGGPNPIVAQMFEHTQLGGKVDPRRVPWCMAFINSCLERSGYVGSKSAMARSALKWGVPLEAPRVGCVVVVWRGDYDDGTHGHVFFYTREDARYVYGVGGNQGDAVSEERFPKSRVLGYRWPRSATRSLTNIGAATSAGSSSGLAGLQTAKEALPAPPPVPTPPSATDAAQQAIEQLQGPLQKAAGFVHGRAAQYLMLGLAVLSIAGAALAIYGRLRVRNMHGI